MKKLKKDLAKKNLEVFKIKVTKKTPIKTAAGIQNKHAAAAGIFISRFCHIKNNESGSTLAL